MIIYQGRKLHTSHPFNSTYVWKNIQSKFQRDRDRFWMITSEDVCGICTCYSPLKCSAMESYPSSFQFICFWKISELCYFRQKMQTFRNTAFLWNTTFYDRPTGQLWLRRQVCQLESQRFPSWPRMVMCLSVRGPETSAVLLSLCCVYTVQSFQNQDLHPSIIH